MCISIEFHIAFCLFPLCLTNRVNYLAFGFSTCSSICNQYCSIQIKKKHCAFVAKNFQLVYNHTELKWYHCILHSRIEEGNSKMLSFHPNFDFLVLGAPMLQKLILSNRNYTSHVQYINILLGHSVLAVWLLPLFCAFRHRLSALQELIAEQCEIAATNQLLIFERELFEVQVDPRIPIKDYPGSISEANPILVFMKSYPDHKYFPRISYRKSYLDNKYFPRISYRKSYPDHKYFPRISYRKSYPDHKYFPRISYRKLYPDHKYFPRISYRKLYSDHKYFPRISYRKLYPDHKYFPRISYRKLYPDHKYFPRISYRKSYPDHKYSLGYHTISHIPTINISQGYHTVSHIPTINTSLGYHIVSCFLIIKLISP